MEKVNDFENEEKALVCDEKKKGEVEQELKYCHYVLKREYNLLYDYQIDYFCWINNRKDIVNSMKSKSLSDDHLEEIMEFCDERNSFLVAKLKTIHSYVSFIKNTISKFDEINDSIDLDSIDTKLRLMLISLGMNLPSRVFGEPF